jgi:short-subunit dehydrogenase
MVNKWKREDADCRTAGSAFQREATRLRTDDKTDGQNAGIGAPRKPMDEISLEDTKALFDVNILAPFLCCQEAIKIMKAQSPQGGR